MSSSPVNHIKCVIVGDNGVGKRSLIRECVTPRKLKENSKPWKIYNDVSVMKNGKEFIVGFSDAKASTDYARLRPLIYLQTDVFLLCYSIISRISFQNAKQKWFPEIRRHCPKTPIILVGTKADLEDNETSIPSSEGMQFAEKIKSTYYLECSSVQTKGIQNILDKLIVSYTQHSGVCTNMQEEKLPYMILLMSVVFLLIVFLLNYLLSA